jgi:GxxExxY protein
MRILELLIRKDDEAVKNIGDPSALMSVYDIDAEEKITADAIEQGKSAKEVEKELDKTAVSTFDPLKILMGESAPPSGQDSDEHTKTMPSLFDDDFHYLKVAVGYLRQSETLQSEFVDIDQQIILTATQDLKHRLRYILPREVWPDDDTFVLSPDRDAIQDEIRRSRKDENAWPLIHSLWQHNPVLEWINDKVVAGFGRHEAPVLSLQKALSAGETVFILSGLIPNLKGHPLVHSWFGVTFQHYTFQKIETFEAVLERTGLGKTSFPNRGETVDVASLRNLLPEAVKQGRQYMGGKRKQFEDAINQKLNEHLADLERLKGKHHMGRRNDDDGGQSLHSGHRGSYWLNHEIHELHEKMDIVYKNESYLIIGACFEVYKEKGCGFLEAVYQECLEIELGIQKIPFASQKTLSIEYKGIPLKNRYIPDFICFDKIILEIKSVVALSDEHKAQVHNYLKATEHKLGLLVNFGHYPKLEYVRIVK